MSDRSLEAAAWGWVPPLVFALVLLALWATGTNEIWFRQVNGWSAVTGPHLWAGITIFGDALVLLALALPILWYRPRWAWALLLAAIGTTVVVHTLKLWLALPRPAAVLGAEAITIIGPDLRAKAMPSGHAAAALTLAGALVPALKGRGARTIVLLFATLVAVSRVVVGAHWPMDVMAGALIGWVSGVISLRAMGERPWMTNRAAVAILAVALVGCAAALFFTNTGYPGTRGIQVVVGITCLGFAGLIVRQIRESMTDA